jgi:2-polyprenyl-3-methyl-5-hydroxy-6-metoxy-1,4-benzoquinol methylase
MAHRVRKKHGVADRVGFVLGSGEDIPLPRGNFDLVTLDDVLEHVISPKLVLDECWRVLRPGGRAAIVFPPYYDVLDGSHLSGRATKFPGLNLLFTAQVLRSAAQGTLKDQEIDFEPFFREVTTDKLWNQNGLTIKEFHQDCQRLRL